VRVGSLLLNALNNQGGEIDPSQMRFYSHFQLPFDFLNIAVIAHFFQWVDGLTAFRNIVSAVSKGQGL